jgi:hypothetical protein
MNLPSWALLSLCIVPLCASGDASAQEDSKWGKPIDLKQFVPPLPPVVPLPRNYDLNPGSVGGSQGSNASSPFQSPASSSTQTAPGIKLTIPSR